MNNYTEDLLKHIAERLSGRSNCRRIEYIVYIGQRLEGRTYTYTEDTVVFEPERLVYPDKHHRQSTDLQDIVDHVIRKHFADTVYDHDDEYGRIHYKLNSLTPGKYEYKLSFNGKRRKWIKSL